MATDNSAALEQALAIAVHGHLGGDTFVHVVQDRRNRAIPPGNTLIFHRRLAPVEGDTVLATGEDGREWVGTWVHGYGAEGRWALQMPGRPDGCSDKHALKLEGVLIARLSGRAANRWIQH